MKTTFHEGVISVDRNKNEFKFSIHSNTELFKILEKEGLIVSTHKDAKWISVPVTLIVYIDKRDE